MFTKTGRLLGVFTQPRSVTDFFKLKADERTVKMALALSGGREVEVWGLQLIDLCNRFQ